MAAKWQQWMPCFIDRWRGSPAVRAMHPAARDGYRELLCSQWQSEDCTLPSDALQLAEMSGLGDEHWTTYSLRILRNFKKLPSGRLQNEVCFKEWSEAKRIFEARQEAAKRTTKIRSPRKKRTVTVEKETVTDASAPRSADTRTLTGTETLTEKQEQKPSRPKAASDKSRHEVFKAAVGEYWTAKNPGIEMPWGQMEGKALGMWLREAPHITIEQFKGFLRGRYRSDVNHAERPGQWIRWITSYAQPIDRFNKPKDESHGQNGTRTPLGKGQSIIAAVRSAIADVAADAIGNAGDVPAGDGGRGDPEILRSEPVILRPEGSVGGNRKALPYKT